MKIIKNQNLKPLIYIFIFLIYNLYIALTNEPLLCYNGLDEDIQSCFGHIKALENRLHAISDEIKPLYEPGVYGPDAKSKIHELYKEKRDIHDKIEELADRGDRLIKLQDALDSKNVAVTPLEEAKKRNFDNYNEEYDNSSSKRKK